MPIAPRPIRATSSAPSFAVRMVLPPCRRASRKAPCPGETVGWGGSGFRNRTAEGFQGDVGGLGAAALAGVEAVYRGQLLGGEFEVEHVEVLGDPRRLGRLRDRRPAPLHVPA